MFRLRLSIIKYYLLLVSDTLKAVIIFVLVLIASMLLGGIAFTPKNIALLLTLNYEPKGLFDSIAQIVIMLLELSPIMAFVDSKTNSEEKRSEIKARVLKDHIILVGCGHLGRRIGDFLLKLGIPFVIVVLPEDMYRNEAVINFKKRGVPIIIGDATHEETLRRANIEDAKAVIVSLDNDITNSVIAEKAKKINGKIRTVVRIFNDDLAEILRKNPMFDEVISTTWLSYHFFAFGAFFDVVPEELLLTLKAPRVFIGKSVESIKNYGIEVVALKRGDSWVRIDQSEVIKEGDIVVIVGKRENLAKFLRCSTSK